jgi:hypothetical protein
MRNRTPTLVLVLVVEFYKLGVVFCGKWAALTNSNGMCVLVLVRWFFFKHRENAWMTKII